MGTSQTFWCLSDGQLIRLAIPAANNLGLNPKILWSSPSASVFRLLWDPTGKAILIPNKNWLDEDSLRRFAWLVWEGNPVTTEWENVPAEAIEKLVSHWLVARPNVEVIRKIQDRISEKELAKWAWGTPVPYALIDSLETFRDQVRSLQPPCILKTRWGGYDGKWQWKITEKTNLEDFWKNTFPDKVPPLILEKMIDLAYEASVIVGIDTVGWMECIGPMYNIHENGILRLSIDPAPINNTETQALLSEAKKIAWWVSSIIDGYVWILTIEFFVDKNRKIYVNEFAPRPHNSGHTWLNSRDKNQNHLWLSTATGHAVEKSHLIRTVVMENILSQRELVDYSQRRRVIDVPGFYDYQKLSSPPSPENVEVRKLWHMNHFWDEVEGWVGEFKEWKIDIEELNSRLRKRPL